MNIIVLFGGLSPEAEVSASSAQQISEHLEKNGHQLVSLNLIGQYPAFATFDDLLAAKADLVAVSTDKSVEITENTLKLAKLADVCFLATHGGIGENGQLQALFELNKIKFTGNRFLSTGVAMDKSLTKKLMAAEKVGVANEYEVYEVTEAVFPIVVKPNASGSSIGVSFPANMEEFKALDLEDVLIEQQLFGREFSVGVVDGVALPPIEIVATEGFYDYRAKYNPGFVQEICPADITPTVDAKLRQAAEYCHKQIGFEVYSRAEFIVDANENIWFIESNSIPGMTPLSLLPQEAAVVGMNYTQLCEKLIALSMKY